MPPKKRPAAVAVDKKEESSSESEDEKLHKEAKKNKAKWFWRGDSGKGELDVWVQYSDDVALKLEKGFLTMKKKDVKNPSTEVKVDKDRYVDLNKLVQRRYDDKKKKRPVKRTTPDSEDSTDEEEMKKIQKRETRASAKAAAKKKAVTTQDTSSDEESDDDEDYVKWMWAGDSNGGPEKGGGHQDVWIDYDKKICKKLEKAFSSATDKEVKVDDQRFIDLQNMLQRRYDDPSKRRNVKRIPPKVKAPSKASKPKAQAKAKAKAKAATTSKKRKNDDTESDDDEEDEKDEKKKDSTKDDEDEQKAKKAKTALTSAPSAMDLLKLPPTWTNQNTMDYQEIELDPKATEFMNIKSHFLDSVEPSHKHNSAIHKVLFSSFEVTKIVRIQCPILWLRYKARKEKILHDAGGIPIPPVPNVFKLNSTDPPVNEFFLYHGLNVSAIPGIAKFGFDPRYCNLAGMFGAGLYFAENSSKSHQYCHAGECTASGPNPASCRCKQSDECCMLICRVTLGDALIEKIYRGNAPGQFWYNKRTEPEKVPGKSIYHSVVGESKKWFPSASLNFREYIVYESSQVYPEYILCFKRMK